MNDALKMKYSLCYSLNQESCSPEQKRKRSFQDRDCTGGSGDGDGSGGACGSGGAGGSSGSEQRDKNAGYRLSKSHRRTRDYSPQGNDATDEACHTTAEYDASDELDYHPVNNESDFHSVDERDSGWNTLFLDSSLGVCLIMSTFWTDYEDVINSCRQIC